MSEGAPGERARASLKSRLTLAIGRFITRVWFTVCYRFRVEGREHIPLEGPVVLVSNHQSYLDPIAVGLAIRKRTFRSIARTGLFTFKPFAWLIYALGAIPIDQEGASASAIRLSIQQVQEGHAIVIFPEGGRTRTGMTNDLKGGVLLILKRTRAPIVPVAIEGAFDVWPAGESMPRLRGRIMLRALPAISYDEFMAEGGDNALLRLREVLERNRLELRAEIQRRSGRRYPKRVEGTKPYWEVAEASLPTTVSSDSE